LMRVISVHDILGSPSLLTPRQNHKWLESLNSIFGQPLRVVLNSVDPMKLRSADLPPDENTLTKRTQTSRRAAQEAFSIDPERDIVRGIAGEPKNNGFGSRVAGSDVLTLWREADVSDLPQICADTLVEFGKKDYQTSFGWIDHIRHERDAEIIARLDLLLITAINSALAGSIAETLHLAWPVVYDPQSSSWVRYKGFRSQKIFTDLDIRNYIDELTERSIKLLDQQSLARHHVEQTDENAERVGEEFSLYDCLVFEAELDDRKYVLSVGRWYEVAKTLAHEVRTFFEKVERYELPPALSAENEVKYIARLQTEKAEWVCMDRKLFRPTGAASDIEACAFLALPGHFIHIKDQSTSSKLSHLFNQGFVSARVFKTDGPFRTTLRANVLEVSNNRLGGDLPGETDRVNASKFTVVFVVLREQPGKAEPKL
jgi:uncharacterized protein (TIGR04141 family)